MAGGNGLTRAPEAGQGNRLPAGSQAAAPHEAPQPPLRRTRRLATALIVLTLVVVLGHLLALDWLARLAPGLSELKAMPEALFTRVLTPSEQDPEVAAPAPDPAAPPAPKPEASLVAAAPSTPASAQVPVPKDTPTPTPTPAPATTPTNTAPATPAVQAPEPRPADPGPATPPAIAAAPAVPPGSSDTVPSPRAVEPAPAALAATPPAAPATGVPGTQPSGNATGNTAGNTAAGTAGNATPSADPLDRHWPVDTRITYKLTGLFRGGPLYGTAKVQWLRQGGLYQARVELSVSPFFNAAYTSQGQVTLQGLIPQAFEDTRGSRRRLTRITDKEVVQHDGRSFERPPGVQDLASQFIEIGHRFRTGQASTALGSTLTLPLVRPGAVDTWTYDIFAHELLRTPRLGELDTVRVTPRPFTNARGTLASEVWFAPRLQYLPVRLKMTFGEEAWADLLVETIEQR